MSAYLKELDLKTLADSTLHKVWEQHYNNYLKTLSVISYYTLDDARKYADSIVASVRKCYHE